MSKLLISLETLINESNFSKTELTEFYKDFWSTLFNKKVSEKKLKKIKKLLKSVNINTVKILQNDNDDLFIQIPTNKIGSLSFSRKMLNIFERKVGTVNRVGWCDSVIFGEAFAYIIVTPKKSKLLFF